MACPPAKAARIAPFPLAARERGFTSGRSRRPMHVAVARALEAPVRAREVALGGFHRRTAFGVVAEVERKRGQAAATLAVDQVVPVVLGIQVDEVAMHPAVPRTPNWARG